jgi:hypothetical protein
MSPVNAHRQVPISGGTLEIAHLILAKISCPHQHKPQHELSGALARPCLRAALVTLKIASGSLLKSRPE